MKIQLPVPYQIEARINRSRINRTEEVLACVRGEFHVRDTSSMDVHLVAEWQQKWDRSIHAEWKPRATGNWLSDFHGDRNLSRLVMIDGSFYSPIKADFPNDPGKPYTVENLHTPSWQVQNVRNVIGRDFGAFWEGEYANLMCRGDFWNSPDASAPFPPPDMTNKTEISNRRSEMEASIQRWLERFVVIDGLLWTKIAEPVIGVFATKNSVEMKITERRDSANSYTTSYFSLKDFQSAYDHYHECLSSVPGRPASMEVADLRIHMPAAFQMNIETTELIKSATQLLETTEPFLGKMPADLAPFWFSLRDILATCSASSSETDLTKLGDSVLVLHDAVSQHHSATAPLKQACVIALPAAQRWELRPITNNIQNSAFSR